MKKTKFLALLVLLSLTGTFTISAQGIYAPAAGEPGSTAIHKDSSIIVAWATNCVVERGYINIVDTTATYTQSGVTSNFTFFGYDSLALGYPETNMTAVSLGDGGSAILEFAFPIKNGNGYDFAVFENGLKASNPPYQYFLELAFVEVSSDGENFVRFPSVSATQTETQVAGFDQLDPTYIHNLAGKYISDYGTPFDLEDLKDSTGLDINNITHIKIIDVVGIINSEFSSYDSQGNIINDPWPTAFWTGGFDLNAVGVINSLQNNIVTENLTPNNLILWPNPVSAGGVLNIKSFNNTVIPDTEFRIVDYHGSTVVSGKINYENSVISIPQYLKTGLYFIYTINSDGKKNTSKIIIK
ncbi:MAG: T9SS type A sorting domain-containing protein [Bacteroidales bacterium]|nr:T9SS type A sorting domain-containing protein [Bacteroidales bacterium]